MIVMVTGGTGFIGLRVMRNLIELGQEVACFDLASARVNLQPYLHAASFYRGDLTQISQLLKAVDTHGITRAIHLAALLPPDSEDRPHYGSSANIQGTNNVFETPCSNGVQRLVYTRSIACYGVQENQRLLTEEDHSNPVNVYVMTKVTNDFTAAKYIGKYDVDPRGIWP